MKKNLFKKAKEKDALPKISFLIAAHNEEKFIGSALHNLENLRYPDYEVIIGLDGCTDRTEEIVDSFAKSSKKFSYFNFNIREGKPHIINEIIKKAKGEIIVIHDSDWIFSAPDYKKLIDYFKVFLDKNTGGIAESFPIEWDYKKIHSGNLGYKMVAYSTYYWMKFQKKTFTHQEGSLMYLSSSKMFLTNVFRKKLYKPDSTLGDDFERTINIMKKGSRIVIFDEPSYPRMIANYNNIPVFDLFRQKIRTAIARNQLKGKMDVGAKDYYIPSIYSMLRDSFHDGIKIGIVVLFWVLLGAVATLYSRFKKISTKEGWKIRIKRYNG